jgi:hypothetical protein
MPFEALSATYLNVMSDSLFERSVTLAILSDFKVSYSLYSSNDYHLVTIESATLLILVFVKHIKFRLQVRMYSHRTSPWASSREDLVDCCENKETICSYEGIWATSVVHGFVLSFTFHLHPTLTRAAMIHESRRHEDKEKSVVFDLATDGIQYQFWRINNASSMSFSFLT